MDVLRLPGRRRVNGERDASRWSAVAVGIGLAQVALAALTAWLLASTGHGAALDDGAAAFLLSLMVFVAVGTVVAMRRPDHPVGWLLLLAPVGMGLYVLLAVYAERGYAAAPYGPPLTDVAAWLQTFAWAPSAAMLFVFVPLLVPDGRLPSPRWRIVAWISIIQTGLIIALKGWFLWPVRGPLLLAPWFVDQLPVDAPRWAHLLLAGALWIFMPLGLVAAASVVLRFRASTGVERQQLKWFLSGTVLLIVALALPVAVWLRTPLMSVAIALWPVAIAIAILRYRLYDIDRLLNRTLVYGVVSGALAVGYLLATLVAQALLPQALRSPVVVAAATLAAATLFRPLRDRVQRLVDRRFNRSRYDAERVVERFSRRMRAELHPEGVRTAFLAEVGTSVQPASASLWLSGRGTP